MIVGSWGSFFDRVLTMLQSLAQGCAHTAGVGFINVYSLLCETEYNEEERDQAGNHQRIIDHTVS